ncbi:lysophospholipid acyltransferase family protein [Facilibium subflavum]|uniref:lysophospholipid acyltransferase family protein n=1 Tax=Facilibium subflavum TaxID=2219058 RepID=UPI000E65901A|nr:lysophospholipid acyltransferase family protein [Facilibium subflavum]
MLEDNNKVKQLKKFGEQLFTFFLYLWSMMSFSMAQRVGWLLGSIVACFNSDIKRVTTKNIELCFPDLSQYHKKRLIKNAIRHTFVTGAEMPAILFKKPNKLLENIHTVYNKELMQKLYEEGRSIMILGPHIGCWEIGSMYYPQHYPAAMLYTPPKIKILDKLIYQARSRLCKRMSPANHKGVKMLFQAMKNKEVVAMLSDQVPVDAGGTYIDFFGVPAKTMNFPGKLYERFKPAVVVSYAVRNGIGKGITLYIDDLAPEIEEAQKIPGIEDPVGYAFTKHFEEVIRKFPAQYQWGYKRFKYNPEGIDFYKKDKQ